MHWSVLELKSEVFLMLCLQCVIVCMCEWHCTALWVVGTDRLERCDINAVHLLFATSLLHTLCSGSCPMQPHSLVCWPVTMWTGVNSRTSQQWQSLGSAAQLSWHSNKAKQLMEIEITIWSNAISKLQDLFFMSINFKYVTIYRSCYRVYIFIYSIK